MMGSSFSYKYKLYPIQVVFGLGNCCYLANWNPCSNTCCAQRFQTFSYATMQLWSDFHMSSKEPFSDTTMIDRHHSSDLLLYYFKILKNIELKQLEKKKWSHQTIKSSLVIFRPINSTSISDCWVETWRGEHGSRTCLFRSDFFVVDCVWVVYSPLTNFGADQDRMDGKKKNLMHLTMTFLLQLEVGQVKIGHSYPSWVYY